MLNFLPRPNRKTGIDLADYCHAAEVLGCDVSTVRAVDAVESAGRGFLPSGRPKILFEGHLFHKLTKGKFSKAYPTISYPSWTKKFYKGGESEYSRLETAYKLAPEAALRSASWSRFQILGDNYRMCGYPSAEAFVEAMFLDEDNSLEAFVMYIMARGLKSAMQRKDFDEVAAGYNGLGYRRNQYHTKMANAERKFAAVKINCREVASTAPIPIDAAFPADCHDSCVGLNNTSFDDRYLVPSSESEKTEAAPGQITNSNLPDLIPPADSISSSSESAINEQSGASGVPGDVPATSLSDKISTGFDKITGVQYKFDVLAGIWDRVPRLSLLKTFVVRAFSRIVQVSLTFLTLILGLPVEYWLLASVAAGLVVVLYLYRQEIKATAIKLIARFT